MVLAVALSAWQSLGLGKSLAVATLRTVLQLLMVGYILGSVFAWQNPWLVLGVILFMGVIAARVAGGRIGLASPWLGPLVFAAIALGTGVTLVYTAAVVIRPSLWYDPHYLIPLAGIMIGNVMNTAAVAGERLASVCRSSRLEIETHLSLGATPAQAMGSYRREAIKVGMMPIINFMLVVGLVVLPGTITGQILGGVDPLQASLYQILIAFMLASSNLIAAIIVTEGLFRLHFNRSAQLRSP